MADRDQKIQKGHFGLIAEPNSPVPQLALQTTKTPAVDHRGPTQSASTRILLDPDHNGLTPASIEQDFKTVWNETLSPGSQQRLNYSEYMKPGHSDNLEGQIVENSPVPTDLEHENVSVDIEAAATRQTIGRTARVRPHQILTCSEAETFTSMHECSSPTSNPPRDLQRDSSGRSGHRRMLSNVSEGTESPGNEDHVVHKRSRYIPFQYIADTTSSQPTKIEKKANLYAKNSSYHSSGTQTDAMYNPTISDQESVLQFSELSEQRQVFRANSSYAQHTEASKAKQSEKVDISDRARRSSLSQSLKEPPYLVIGQRPTTSLRHKRSGASLRNLMDAGCFDQAGGTGVERPRTSHKPENTFKSTISQQAHTDAKERSAFTYSQKIDDATEGHNAITSLWVELTTAKAENTELHKEKENLSIKLAVTQVAYDDASKRAEKLEQIQRNYHLENQNSQSSSEDAHPANDNYKQILKDEDLETMTLQAHITALEDTNVKLKREIGDRNQELRRKTSLLSETEVELHECDNQRGQLRQVFQDFSDALDQALHGPSGPPSCIGILKKQLQSCFSTSDTEEFQTKFFHYLDRVEGAIHMIFRAKQTLKEQLLAREHELYILQESLDAKLQTRNDGTIEKRHAQELKDNTWKNLYHDARRKLGQKTSENEQLKKNMKMASRLDLHKKFKELQIDLDGARDEANYLRGKMKQYNTRKKQWEEEYKDLKRASEKIYEEHKATVIQQQDEMRVYIKEYHDKVKNPEFWNLQGLRKIVRSLEGELRIMNDLFGATKTENARLKDDYDRMSERNMYLEKENDRLRNGAVLGYAASPFQQQSSSPQGSSPGMDGSDNISCSSLPFIIAPTRTAYEAPFIPHCHLPAGIEERAAKLADLEKYQQKHREEDKKSSDLMEKVRRWRLEELEKAEKRKKLERKGETIVRSEDVEIKKEHEMIYPLKKNIWEKLTTETSWERWGGDKFLENMEITDQEYSIVQRLRKR